MSCTALVMERVELARECERVMVVTEGGQSRLRSGSESICLKALWITTNSSASRHLSIFGQLRLPRVLGVLARESRKPFDSRDSPKEEEGTPI